MLELDDLSISIDNFALSQWLTCKRKFYWRIIEGLVPISPKGTARGFGAAFHEALAEWYKLETPETERESRANDAFYRVWDDYGLGGGDAMRSTKVFEQVFRQYRAKWQPEWFEPLHTEVGFALPLTHNIIYQGRMDLLATDKASGKLVIVDHKTALRKPSQAQIEVKTRQISGYIWAAQQLSDQGVMCNSAIVNYIILTTQPQFERVLSTRTSEQIDEWQDATIRIINEIRNACTIEDCYCNQESCSIYGSCDYLELCNTPKNLRQELIKHKFESKPWQAFNEDINGNN